MKTKGEKKRKRKKEKKTQNLERVQKYFSPETILIKETVLITVRTRRSEQGELEN